MYGLELVPSEDDPAPPIVEPLSLESLREWLRVDDDDVNQDLVISELRTAAREYAERWLGQQLITQRWKMTLDQFPPDGVIELPKTPLQSVVSIVYTDTLNVPFTLATTQYVVDTTRKPGRIIRAFGVLWPILFLQPSGLAITFDAGYGDFPNEVPQSIKQAMKLLVSWDYEQRTPAKVELERVHDLLRLNWDGSYR